MRCRHRVGSELEFTSPLEGDASRVFRHRGRGGTAKRGGIPRQSGQKVITPKAQLFLDELCQWRIIHPCRASSPTHQRHRRFQFPPRRGRRERFPPEVRSPPVPGSHGNALRTGWPRCPPLSREAHPGANRGGGTAQERKRALRSMTGARFPFYFSITQLPSHHEPN